MYSLEQSTSNSYGNTLLCAATRLLEVRANTQLTEDEWDALAQTVIQDTGQYIQWRTDDELKPE